ncbi:Pentatricopeptide repeat-containing protein [Camellia lanceoleosa]|uniref:Pentatricopeptide repeat-containing protein n=1 Tax=Camellia lanceoleosa TaxID=1840588 RepID=A0ACC0J4K9_9ERIC|nr:Pentatricopeptide repeat-containing protein [Camellia lanceoleosa]
MDFQRKSESPNLSTTQIPNSFPDEPSSAFYDHLIDGASRQKDFAIVLSLLNKRSRDGFFNTTNTFNFISTDLSQTLASLDRGFTRKSAFDALVSRLSRLGRPLRP